MTQPTQSRGSPCTAKRVTCATTPSTTGELVDAICGHNALRQDNWSLMEEALDVVAAGQRDGHGLAPKGDADHRLRGRAARP
jgi:hypothetical protein